MCTSVPLHKYINMALAPPPPPWQSIIKTCMRTQLHQLKEGTFDARAAVQQPPESSWASFVCSVASGVLHQCVDAVYFTSTAPTEFARLERVMLDAMKLEINPDVHGDRLYLFGPSKPYIRLSRLQPSSESADPISNEDGKGTAAVNQSHLSIDSTTACHEARLCVLIAALAIWQASLHSQYARGFALMVKAVLGEVRAAQVHVTSDTIPQIAHALGRNHHVLDMLDDTFDAIATHSLKGRVLCIDGGGGNSGTTSIETTPRAATATVGGASQLVTSTPPVMANVAPFNVRHFTL